MSEEQNTEQAVADVMFLIEHADKLMSVVAWIECQQWDKIVAIMERILANRTAMMKQGIPMKVSPAGIEAFLEFAKALRATATVLTKVRKEIEASGALD